MNRNRIALVALAALSAAGWAACGQEGGDSTVAISGAAPAATVTHETGCGDAGLAFAKARGRVDAVAGAARSTSANVAAWHEQHGFGGGELRQRSPQRDNPPGQSVDVCIYRGHFNLNRGPVGSPRRTFTNLVVWIPDGSGPQEVEYTNVPPPAP